MYVDFEHLAKFSHSDSRFIQTIVTKYYMHEPDLKAALGKFMSSMGLNGDKKKTLFQVAVFNLPQMSKIRELRTTGLGRLSAITGTVTRTTDSKPELLMGTFACLECQSVVANIEQQFKYTEPLRCSN